MVLSGIITAVSQAFQTFILILLEIFRMGREATKEILDFQRSQPIAFTLIVGTMLVIFIATPFLFNFSWNTVLFGRTDYVSTTIEPAVFLTHLTPEQRNAVLSSMDLVKVSENATTEVLFYPNTPIGLAFGEIPQVTVSGIAAGATRPFGEAFQAPSRVGADIVINTWNQGSDSFRNYQEGVCFDLATQDHNGSAWEVMLIPDEPQLVRMLQLSINNPELRKQDVWASCYEVETDASTEIVLPGENFVERGKNLTLFMQNGSICDDKPLNSMAFEASIFSRGRTISANPLSWFAAIEAAPPLLYWAFDSINDFLFAENKSSLTPAAPISCYLMVNRTSRQRFYKGEPQWLIDAGGPNTGLWTSLMYGYQVLSKPSVTQEEWQSLEAIEVATPIGFHPGIASILLMPYEETKRTTNTLTLDQTKKYWEMFEDVIIGVIMVIIGLSGIVLVLNAKDIKLI